VAPAGAAYLRATCTTAAYATFQIEIGTTQTAYAAYTILKVLQTTTEDYYANAATPALVASLITAISSGLSVTTSAIADAAVTPPKTTFFVVGKNKFNINSAGNVLGSYINYTNGNPTVNASFNATDYIPVVAGTTYTFSAKHQMAWYNAAKVYISGSNSTDTVKQQTAPAGAAFVRSSVTLANWSTFQVEVGAVQTAFEAYSFYLQSTDGTPLVVPGVALDINTLQALFAINRERAALVAVAPVLYTLLNKEIAIGYAALLKYYDDYKGKTDIVITGAKITGRNAKLLPTATGTVPYSINIYNEQFNQIVTKAGNIIVSNPATVTPVKILLEGDSYTLKGDFTNVLMASAGATGVTWLGIRNTASATVTINAEGRGGYTLARYLTLWKETTLYSPFMQPTGNTYKYFGVTGYWKIVNGAGGYDWDNYPPAIKSLFDTSTGYLIAPTTDSVMYDDVAAKFYNWSGGAWVEIAEATLNFTFNFAKYRATWGIAAPDIFHSLMGTNDFASMSETDIITYWPTWRANMDTVIASIKADTAGCKIIIGIPNAPGKQLPDGALVNEKRNRAFWYHASMIVTTYGNRTAENLYIADYHTVVDREYGFANADEKPFNDYSGAYRDQWKADTVHLSPDGFLQMGNLFAGLIQALR
jgi:hypothetical protein